MADEQFGEKTEEPSQRRLDEARQRGQVPKSTDLTAALVLLGGVAALQFAGGYLGESLIRALRETLRFGPVDELSGTSVYVELLGAAKHYGLAMAPILVTIAVVAAVANLVQTGFVYSSQPLVPSLEKLNPFGGFKRIVSKRALARLVGSLAKLAAVVWLTTAVIADDAERIVALAGLDMSQIGAAAGELVLSLSFKLVAIFVVLAVLDLLYQRWQYRQDLRMTKQEVREEMKRMEGDPLIKEQRRHIQRQQLMHRMSAEVPKADAVITNPTHVAVAIRYDADKMAAPQVVAKGADYLAQQIRRIAMENDVPIIERPPLARALYKQCEPGQEVPVEFYRAVAEVLAFVYRIEGREFNPAA